jgi:ATP/ADP translocase
MWWGIGFGAVIYFIVLFTLGLWTLRKGHWLMFILGIFVPLFWLIGAVIPPTPARAY